MPIIRKGFREQVDELFKLPDFEEDVNQSMAQKALQGPPPDTEHDGQYILMPPRYADVDALQAPPRAQPPVDLKKDPLLFTLCTPTLQSDIISEEKKKGKLEAPPSADPGQYILMPPSYADPDALKAPPVKGPPLRYATCVPTKQQAVDPYAYPYYPWEFQKRSQQQKRQLNDLLRWNGPYPEDIEDNKPSAEELAMMQKATDEAHKAGMPVKRLWLVRTIWT